MSVKEEMLLQDDGYVVIVVEKEGESSTNELVSSLKLDVNFGDVGEGDVCGSDNNFDCDIQYLDDDLFMIEDSITDRINKKSKSRNRQVRWQIPIEDHYSYVEEVRNQYPECLQNEEMLVDKIREMMENCKPEQPPEGFLTETGILECAFCNHANTSLNEAKRHYQWKHGPRYLLCYACGTNFRSMTNLAKHEKICMSKDAYIVLMARAKVVGLKGRNRPYIDKKLNKLSRNTKKIYKYEFQCPECSAKFKSKDVLLSHINFHEGKRPYQCTQCPAAYTSSVTLHRHMKSHDPDYFICDTCSAKFTTKTTLITHLNTHLPAKKYACTHPGCEKRYSQKHTLLVHIDVDHLNKPLPFRCELCKIRFRRMYRLQVHMKAHHGLQIMTRNMYQKKLPTLQNPDDIKPNAVFFDNLQMIVWDPTTRDTHNPEVQTKKSRRKNDENRSQ